jgi:dienelactone hydrolase
VADGRTGGAGARSGRECVGLELERTAPEFGLDGMTPAGWPEWQRRLRERLWGLLGGARGPVPPDLRVGPPEPDDGFAVRRLEYATEDGVRTSAYLLTPEPARRRPGAVLALHGHGGGKDDVVGRGDRARTAAHRYAYGAALARRGFLVLAPDARGFGERAGGSERGCHVVALASLWLGRPVAAQRLADDIASLSLLRALGGGPGLAVVGLSEGGRRAAFLAALDERVRVAAVSGYFTTLRREVAAWERLWGWDLCNAVPGLCALADLPELLACCAPRHLWVEVGTEDPLFSPEAVAEGARRLAAAYAAAGVPERFRFHSFAGGHTFSGEPCLDGLSAAREAG